MADDKQSVAVIGGGVSGLTAAHELSQRGFAVTVFEKSDVLGGKARSTKWNLLLAEHGFRFFPGFYTHVIDTMRRIDTPDGLTVADQLVDLDVSWSVDGEGNRMATPLPTRERHPTWCEHLYAVCSYGGERPSWWECACFVSALARLVCSCDARWDGQLERESWLDYIMPPGRTRRRSAAYQRLFAKGLTRTFVATRAEEMSARTGGRILLQLLYDTFAGPGDRITDDPTRPPDTAADRALNGPTSEVWIDPWRALLAANGVDFKKNSEVTALSVRETGPVDGLTVAGPAEQTEFDFYVLAVPCEVLKQLLVNTPQLVARDPKLSGVFALQTRWMNGIVFGLDFAPDPPLPRGHVLCLDSPWALTLLDQSKVWKDLTPLQEHGWEALLSVDISDWEAPGGTPHTPVVPAEWLTPRPAISEEVWRQLGRALPQIKDVPCPPFALDHDVKYRGSPRGVVASPAVRPPIADERTDDEPLLINIADSWQYRPEATTAVENLFVAGDFPRTNTDFASMEAANEAARKAVNALLDRSGYHGERCKIWELVDPNVRWFRVPAGWARSADRIIVKYGLPMRPPFRFALAAWLALAWVERRRSFLPPLKAHSRAAPRS